MANPVSKVKKIMDIRKQLGRKNLSNKRRGTLEGQLSNLTGANKGVQQGPQLPGGFYPQPAPGFKPKHHKYNTSGGGGGGTKSTGTHGIDVSRGWGRDGVLEKGSGLASWGMNNIQKSLTGNQTVLGVAANHAIRGAIGGGAIGGTMEAAQGGDFWAGAKAGAFNGAVGWGGYRMGMRATGAKSLNPLKGINSKNAEGNGMIANAGRMISATSMKKDVSKQAAALLSHQQRLGLQQTIYNAGK
jgi:hypothetical protein